MNINEIYFWLNSYDYRIEEQLKAGIEKMFPGASFKEDEAGGISVKLSNNKCDQEIGDMVVWDGLNSSVGEKLNRENTPHVIIKRPCTYWTSGYVLENGTPGQPLTFEPINKPSSEYFTMGHFMPLILKNLEYKDGLLFYVGKRVIQ